MAKNTEFPINYYIARLTASFMAGENVNIRLIIDDDIIGIESSPKINLIGERVNTLYIKKTLKMDDNLLFGVDDGPLLVYSWVGNYTANINLDRAECSDTTKRVIRGVFERYHTILEKMEGKIHFLDNKKDDSDHETEVSIINDTLCAKKIPYDSENHWIFSALNLVCTDIGRGDFKMYSTKYNGDTIVISALNDHGNKTPSIYIELNGKLIAQTDTYFERAQIGKLGRNNKFIQHFMMEYSNHIKNDKFATITIKDANGDIEYITLPNSIDNAVNFMTSTPPLGMIKTFVYYIENRKIILTNQTFKGTGRNAKWFDIGNVTLAMNVTPTATAKQVNEFVDLVADDHEFDAYNSIKPYAKALLWMYHKRMHIIMAAARVRSFIIDQYNTGRKITEYIGPTIFDFVLSDNDEICTISPNNRPSVDVMLDKLLDTDLCKREKYCDVVVKDMYIHDTETYDFIRMIMNL